MDSKNYTRDNNTEQWIEFIKLAISHEFIPREAVVIFVSITFILGIITNVLTCLVILCDKTMYTATNYYLLNLAISDIIYTFSQSSQIYIYIRNGTTSKETLLECKILTFATCFFCNNGILTVTALAIERYLVISKPMKFISNKDWKRLLKIFPFIWILAVVVSLPDILSIDLLASDDWVLCAYMPTKSNQVMSGILALLMFGIPLLMMIILYAMIVLKIKQMEKSNSKKNIFNKREHGNKVHNLVVALTLSFLLCWGPNSALRLMVFTLDIHQLKFYDKAWSFLACLSVVTTPISVVSNPILFSLMSSKFRQALEKFWRTKIRRKTAEHTTVTATANIN